MAHPLVLRKVDMMDGVIDVVIDGKRRASLGGGPGDDPFVKGEEIILREELNT